MKAILAMEPGSIAHVFSEEDLGRLRALLDIDTSRAVTDLGQLSEQEKRELEVMVTGWGVPSLSAEDLDSLPALRAIVHWGGGVGFLDSSAAARGIAVSSARAVNAVPVAEFTVAMIILAAKDAFWASRAYASRQARIDREAELPHTGLFGKSIGIVGASSIGTLVMQKLREHDVEVFLYDPWVTPETSAELGAELIPGLDELASRSRILSVHAPDIPELRGMISRRVLAALPDGATVINTSRGALVDQDALVDELRSGRLRAILDVTEPDVLPPGHPLYTLENAFLTPHVAGSMGSELRRLGASTTDEVARFVSGVPFQHPILP